MIWVFMFNISIGLFYYAGTGVGAGSSAWRVTGTNETAYIGQTQQMGVDFNSSTTIPAQSSTNLWYRFLDLISLGLFSIIQNILNSTIYAIPSLLLSMGIIPPGMELFLIAILTTIYTIGCMELFSGKDISQR